ncbi:DUF4160 domain-containing protein [Sphingoaurantiacus capsulatus]|uniref:DUF4160 domain-containing protein n=1 Tax=Sphingoaurantiacus capsulatus TaxID=1771310 RepID=A0ABV7XCQ6_9SPHN
MPSIHREGSYRFFFYAGDHPPPHVHVERDGRAVKFLLRPVRLVLNDGFNARDLAKIERMVQDNVHRLEDAWHGHSGKPAR